MSKWISIDEFSSLTKLSIDQIHSYIKDGELASKTKEDNTIYIKSTKSARALVVSDTKLIEQKASFNIDTNIVEKAIDTILDLHEESIESKDETIKVLHSENEFLKESVVSLQELYSEAEETIQTLRDSVSRFKKDAEFMSRKYKLMWNQAIENGDK